jgi:hypothetical protein
VDFNEGNLCWGEISLYLDVDLNIFTHDQASAFHGMAQGHPISLTIYLSGCRETDA